ncbi:hypothetical protein ACFC1T_04380 [Kitasatospora sp. NPDC056076]|uniref:hypothetical protein n=1 Tax=Kitasatospora sp. NPDC056076 TaxID=3345703 RepID=UPI0035D97678
MTDIDSFEGGVEQAPEPVPADPAEAIRAEIHREYAGKLALAELRAQAVKEGITLYDGFADYLDLSKLLDTDGQPSQEAIQELLSPWRKKESEFADLQGAGYHRNPFPAGFFSTPSLDARQR